MRLLRALRATALATCAGGLLAAAGPAAASVEPSSSETTLQGGQSTTIEKTATVPELPSAVDVGMLVDLSQSYIFDLWLLQQRAMEMDDQVAAVHPDAQFGVTSFIDFPFEPWSYTFTVEFAYFRQLDLTADRSQFDFWMSGLGAQGQADEPESQLEALLQIATGAGRDLAPPGPSRGDVPAGLGLSFRPHASKFVVLATDAPFHSPGDSMCDDPPPCPFPYPGPTMEQVLAALNTAGIKVIAVKSPGAGAEMDFLAHATGGAVVDLRTAGPTAIGDAILARVGPSTVDIVPDGSACAPIQVTFTPASYTDVPAGESRKFEEHVAVPPNTPPGTYECTVDFGPAGQQTLRVVIPRWPTELVAEPAIASAVPGLKVPLGRLEARLTSGGTPVPGKSVTMTVGSQTICAATTDGNGVASCSGTFNGLLSVVLNLGYQATFAGDDSYRGSTDEAPIVRAAGVNLLRG